MAKKVVLLVRSSHPGPSVAVTLIMVGLGFGAGLDAWRIVVLGFAMLFGELSVGLSNDWIDAARDAAVGRKDKPVALGLISPALVRNTAFVCAAISLTLIVWLGWAATLAFIGAIGAAWAYNAGLKRTVFSVLAYAVGFGLLPAVATLARAHPEAPAFWALIVGALLGIAAHFANTLPDLDDDAATGVSGLPHRLGRRWSSALTYLVLLVASGLEFWGTGGLPFIPGDIGLALAVVIAIIGASILNRPTRWHFRLIILASLVDVIVLIFAGRHILG